MVLPTIRTPKVPVHLINKLVGVDGKHPFARCMSLSLDIAKMAFGSLSTAEQSGCVFLFIVLDIYSRFVRLVSEEN